MMSDTELNEAEIRYLGDVQRLKLDPGDIIVLTIDDVLTEAQSAYIKHRVEETIPGHTVVVLGKGVKIGVLSPK